MTERMSFGDLLRQLRVEAGLTQEALAERAGLSTPAVSALERGARRAPYRATIRLLADALGLDAPARAALAAAVRPSTAPSGAGALAVTVPVPVSDASGGGARTAFLPAPLTSFVGRQRELAASWLLVSEGARLLTLTGPGGVGKSRLAVEGALVVRDHFPDGVWLVDLTALPTLGLVAQMVATTLGVHETAGQAYTDSLVVAIGDRRALLLLDNCERLVAACAELAVALLSACPQLVIVATSREPLAVAGEHVYPVPSLAAPEDAGSAAVEIGPRDAFTDAQLHTSNGLCRYAAVELFVQRARAVRPDFALTEGNAAAVAEICRRLDGLPLAIELVAARVRVLTPEQIAARLNDRLRLLVGGPRASAPHHQTLRALLDWSHDLLSAPGQTALRRLSVFAGGWSLEAAESVCAGGGIDAADMLELLTALIDRSLVVAETRAETARYRMLESIREYAADKLEWAGEVAAVRARRQDRFLGQAEAGARATTRSARSRWLAAMAADHDNLRAAFEWSFAGGHDPETALRLSVALWEFWVVRHLLSEARAWHTRALEAIKQAAPALRARAQAQMAILCYFANAYDAGVEAAETALALTGVPGDARTVIQALRAMALCAAARGESERAREWLDRALERARALGDPRVTALVLDNLALEALEDKDPAGARRWLDEALAVARAADDAVEAAFVLALLGFCALDAGDLPEARARYGDGLALAAATDHMRHASYCLLGLAQALARGGQRTRAAQLLAIWEELCNRHGLGLHPSEPAIAARLWRELDPAVLVSAQAMGRPITFDEAIRYGLEASRAEPEGDAEERHLDREG